MKNKLMLSLIFLLLLFSNKVYAKCNDEDLNDWAEEVNIIFDEQYALDAYTDENGKEVPAYIPEYSYLLYFNNMDEDIIDKIRVVANDNYSDKEYSVSLDEDYNNYVIGSYIHFKEKNYTIKIYSRDDIKDCNGELLRTIKYSVPSYNMYSNTSFCEKNPSEDICIKFSDTSNITEEKFDEITKDITNQKDKTIIDKIVGTLLEYWYYVLIPIVAVSIYFIIKIKVYKKKVEKE